MQAHTADKLHCLGPFVYPSETDEEKQSVRVGDKEGGESAYSKKKKGRERKYTLVQCSLLCKFWESGCLLAWEREAPSP